MYVSKEALQYLHSTIMHGLIDLFVCIGRMNYNYYIAYIYNTFSHV